MLGIALGLSLVYECIRCMRARQKVRAEGENNFVTPNYSFATAFLDSSHNFQATLVTQRSLRIARHEIFVTQHELYRKGELDERKS